MENAEIEKFKCDIYGDFQTLWGKSGFRLFKANLDFYKIGKKGKSTKARLTKLASRENLLKNSFESLESLEFRM